MEEVYSKKWYIGEGGGFGKYKGVGRQVWRKIRVEVRRQEGIEERWKVKLNPRTDKFKKSELPEKYTAKLLFGWDNRKFEDEYLKKLEKNW